MGGRGNGGFIGSTGDRKGVPEEGGVRRPGAVRLQMADPHVEPANRHERRARDAWLKANAPKKGMTPAAYLDHLRSLSSEELEAELSLLRKV